MRDNARHCVHEHFNIEDSMSQIKQVCLEGHYRTSEILPTVVSHER